MTSQFPTERLDELLRFLPIFEDSRRDWSPAWKQVVSPFGKPMLPVPVYQPEVLEFFELAGDDCWTDASYSPSQAATMLANPAFMESASLTELRGLLTYCVRGERFAEGHWGLMLSRGYIVILLKRLQALRETASPHDAA